jgi:hypothetical protein
MHHGHAGPERPTVPPGPIDWQFPDGLLDPGGLSPAYKTMLSTGGTAMQAATITATFGGLTVGHQYRLQWWTSNPKNGLGYFSETFATTTAGSGGNQVTLDSNSTKQ